MFLEKFEKSLHCGFNDSVEGMMNAATLLNTLPTRPRLLALGEPTHGREDLLELRNDFFRQLVDLGYRTIAVESDCLKGLVVDDYLASGDGDGDLDAVVERGFSHGWGAYAGNRELVRWIRAYNDGRPDAERLRFVGFDGPLEIAAADSPRQALMELHGCLIAHVDDADLLPCTAETLDRLIGADERWTNEAAMLDAAQSVGRTAQARELRLLADEMGELVDELTPQLETEDLRRARLYARTAIGLLRYHFWMADTSQARMTRLVGVRDSMMAANLLALAEQSQGQGKGQGQEEGEGHGPVLVYAHNAHLQREKSSMQMWQGRVEWWSAGAIVGARLGAQYASVSLDGSLDGDGNVIGGLSPADLTS